MRTSWQRLSVVFGVAMLFDVAAWGQVQTFTPQFLRAEFGFGPEEVGRWTGILASTSLFFALPMGPFWGVLSDRIGRKAIVLRGFFLSSIAFGLFAIAPSIEWLILSRVVFGLAFGIMVGIMAAQSDITPSSHIASAVSFIQMMNPIGLAIGPFLGGFFVQWLGLRPVFGLAAALEFMSFLTVLLFFNEQHVSDKRPMGAKLTGSIGQIFRTRELAGVFVVIFIMGCGGAMLDPYMPVYLDQLYQGADSATFVGTTVSIYWLITGGLTPLMGRLADRHGRERVFAWALAGIALCALLMAWLPFASDQPAWVLAALHVLRGVPQAGTIGLAFTMVLLYVSPEQRAAILSLTPFPRHLASFLAPLMGAALAGFGPTWLFFVAGGFYLAAWFIVQRVILRRRPAAESAGVDS